MTINLLMPVLAATPVVYHALCWRKASRNVDNTHNNDTQDKTEVFDNPDALNQEA